MTNIGTTDRSFNPGKSILEPPVQKSTRPLSNPRAGTGKDSPPDTPAAPHREGGESQPEPAQPHREGRPEGSPPTPQPTPNPIGGSRFGTQPAVIGPVRAGNGDSGGGQTRAEGRGSDRPKSGGVNGYLQFGGMAVKPHQYRLLQTLPENTRALLEHLIRCAARGHARWIPVAAALMQAELPTYVKRTADVWEPLQALGWIDVKAYTPPAHEGATGESREFRITEAFWQLWTGERPYARPSRRVDGRRHRSGRTVYTTTLQDENGHPVAEGVAMEFLRYMKDHGRVRVDWQALTELQERRRRELQAMAPTDERYERMHERYVGDALRMDTMRAQQIDRGGRWLTYRPAYAVQEKSGRVTELGGGFQNLTREAKDAAMAGQETVYNYDLRSAHQAIAVAFCEALGIDPGPITAFDRAAMMRSTGITKREAKAALFGVFNGASLPASMQKAEAVERFYTGAVLTVPDVARRAAARQGIGPQEIYGRLRGSLEPVRDTMRGLVRAYVGPYAEKHATYGRGGRYLTNAAGIRLNLNTVDVSTHEGRAAAACHLLQGTEAAIGHELTQLQERYGYRVVSHEHDGLVTEGEIPPAAVREALQRVGDRIGVNLTALQLVLKPYDEHKPTHWTDGEDTAANATGGDRGRGGHAHRDVRESAGEVYAGPQEPGSISAGDGSTNPDHTAGVARSRPIRAGKSHPAPP